MAHRRIKVAMDYHADTEEDAALVLQAMAQAVIDVRAVAQTLFMGREKKPPMPEIRMESDHLGHTEEIDPDKWLAEQAAKAEEDSDVD